MKHLKKLESFRILVFARRCLNEDANAALGPEELFMNMTDDHQVMFNNFFDDFAQNQ